MQFPRESGVLLHLTSLPGPHGIGDFGPAAFRFVDWLADAGQRLWQVMPLGPTAFGDSPYASPSAFAGNPLLVSLSWLKGDGLLDDSDFGEIPAFPAERCDFGPVIDYKTSLLRRAFDRFEAGEGYHLVDDFYRFEQEEAMWLDDYALFMAVKEAHSLQGWHSWERSIRMREPAAISRWSAARAPDIRYQKFVQFHFSRQWSELRRYANQRKIRVIGDIPIFVAEDSADVWANQDLFKLNEEGKSLEVTGVPPDPFSATGQIWGNPVYDWKRMRFDGYQWWIDRIGRMLKTVDVIRIDHFRAFAAAWLVPASASTAADGHWELAPGGEVFAAIRRALGDVPVIIEDLGVITPDVISLREILGCPGMNVLQFAFENDSENVYLPHNHRRESVVYTATHDNQTTVGWFASRSDSERTAIQRYLGRNGSDIAWDLIRVALASVANTVILSLQDVLRLGDEARMNVPGQPSGNWSWRFRADQLTPELAQGLRDLTSLYGRPRDGGHTAGANPWDYTHPGGKHQAINPLERVAPFEVEHD